MRRQWVWTDHQLVKLNWVLETLKEWDKYKPLTLRQVYYQLVGKGHIENEVSQYNMMSGLLKWARIDGYVSWNDIEDRVRAYHDLTGWGDSDSYQEWSLNRFLSGYRRDLMQTQDVYIEVWIEKDALSSMFTKVAKRYSIPVTVCRGFSSVSFLNDYKERLDAHSDKQPVMLYFGDFDPSGMEMLPAMEKTLNGEMGVRDIKYKRIALMEEDVHKYKLLHNPKAIKRGDTRTEKHIEAYGALAVELDALRPDVLESKIETAIEAEIDIDLFNEEVEKSKPELDRLDKTKQKVVKLLGKGSV